MAQKGPKGLKTGQNDTKTMTKRCQNDAKMIRKWPQSDPGSKAKMVQNHSKMTHFGPILAVFWAILTRFFKKKSKEAQKRSKRVKNGSKVI